MQNISHFFIITPPGLEETTLNEIASKWPLYFKSKTPNLDPDIGGIHISCDQEEGFLLNKILKTPTRILMRIDEFKCRDAPRLYNKIAKINWSQYILSTAFEVLATAHDSRLFDSRKIESAVKDGINKYIIANPIKKNFMELAHKNNISLQVYIRLNNDVCTVSIDTSGELLYKRGEKELTGNAPIRENIANALLQELIDNTDIKKINILDPMCGAGTFLLEAQHFNELTNTRNFSFEYFPLSLKNLNKITIPVLDISHFNKISGHDIDEKIVIQARTNLSKYNIEISEQDLFNTILQNKPSDEFQNFIIVNPPYGIRIKTESFINDEYYQNLMSKIVSIYNPKRLGIIVPNDYNPIIDKRLKIVKKLKFKNGGIPVNYFVLESK